MQTLKVLKNAEGLALRINHILFAWYYKRVDDHFKQWTFIKSVKMLIQHWEHDQFIKKGNDQLIKNAIKEERRLVEENSRLRISQIATDGQIRWARDVFGIKWNPPTEN